MREGRKEDRSKDKRRTGGICCSYKQLICASFRCFLTLREAQSAEEKLSFAGAEPLWAEHHTVRGGEVGGRWGEGGWGGGLGCPLTRP